MSAETGKKKAGFQNKSLHLFHHSQAKTRCLDSKKDRINFTV